MGTQRPPGDRDATGPAPAREPLLLLPGSPAEAGPGLDALAERLRAAFAVDAVVIRAAGDGEDAQDDLGVAYADRDARDALEPALGALTFGEGGDELARGEVGTAMLWPQLGEDPSAIALLDRLEEAGAPVERLRRRTPGASAVSMRIATGPRRRPGSVWLIDLAGGRPLDELDRARLEALADQLPIAIQNAQLRERHRRTRLTLEAVLAASPSGVIVTDLRGRLTMVNRAASKLLEIDLAPLVGKPFRRVLADQLKWRFTKPDEVEARLAWLFDHPHESANDEVETVSHRILERYSAPMRDPSGALVGRVQILSDVTASRRALEEARRLAEEKAALLAVEERRAQEEAALARAAHVMASALSRDDIHEHLLQQAERLAQSEKSAVLVVDRRGDVVPVAARGFADSTLARMIYRRGEGLVGRVIESQRAVICNDTLNDARVSQRITGPEGIRSFMHVPLVLGERSYGLLSVNSSRPRAFGETELRVLSELARHAASALQNALQFEQERHIAETLQQALLADDPPPVPGLALATLYRAAAGSQVGGDLYNVWPLPDGRTAVLVGDVSGKGVEAAGLTAMVRYTAEALSLREADPAVLLGEANGLFVARLPEATMVSAFMAVIDVPGNRISWCSAGHPPPVVVSAGRSLRTLEDPGPPLGAFPDSSYRGHEDPFEPGDLLFIYTDGLVEARRHGRVWGEERLADALIGAIDEPPDRLARSVYAAARVWSGGRIADDVAIAVVKRTA